MSRHWKPERTAQRYLPWWLQKQLRKAWCRKALRLRDGDNCWRCHRPMRFGPPFNVGKAASIEHLQALSAGGTWALDNLVLCHVGCNRHLGTNPPDHKERMRLK